MRTASRAPLFALAGWTLFVWATRIRNAVADDDLSGGSKAVAVTVATLFTLGGLAVLVAVIRRSHVGSAVRALAAFTVVYWPVRVLQIIAADHAFGFTVVHTVLGIVSVGLAVFAWTSLAGSRTARPAGVLPRR